MEQIALDAIKIMKNRKEKFKKVHEKETKLIRTKSNNPKTSQVKTGKRAR
jgi:hypothetical protein